GTNVTGDAALGNGRFGVFLAAGPGNRIGTNSDGVSDLAERNVISGNLEAGIFIQGDTNLAAGNYIGPNAAAAPRLPTGTAPWLEHAKLNAIGGRGPGAGNLIAFNSGYGIQVHCGAGNVLVGNSVFSNGVADVLTETCGALEQAAALRAGVNALASAGVLNIS